MNRKVHMLIEKDITTAEVCAKRFGYPVLTANEYIQKILNKETIEACILNDTIENPKTWMAVGLANPEAILGSPPCQPWSGAGSGQGLSSSDGKAMQALLGWAGTIGVATVVIENVPGLRKHADYDTIIQEAKRDGMIPILADVYQCAPAIPVKRERWLATFVHCTVNVQTHRIQLAASISFTDHLFNAVCRSPSLSESKVLHCNMSDQERCALTPSDDLWKAMGNPEYVPSWLKSKAKGTTADAFIEGRTVQPHHQMGTIMAMYGKQHELGHELLQSKGLHTTMVCDSKGKRLFSPWEVIAALGYPCDTVLHKDLQTSYTLAGNGLSIAHGWLALYKTHVLLGPASPFTPNGSQIDQVTKFIGNMIQMDKYETSIDGECWFLIKQATMDEPNMKKQRCELPPTVPFVAVEGAVDDAISTKPFLVAPPFENGSDPRIAAVQGLDYADGLMVLSHVQKHWTMMINFEKSQTIGVAIAKGLPHAKPIHFVELVLNGKEVSWNHALTEPGYQKVVFSPTPYLVMCVEQTLNIALTLRADVTWTIKSGMAYCATHLGCHIDAISLMNDGKQVLEDDYMVEFSKHEFQIAFKTNVPGYVALAEHAKAEHDLDIRVAPASFTRFFAKHPLKKVTRTVSFPVDGTMSQVIQALFPDLHGSTAWTIHADGEQIPREAYANAWQFFQVQWETLRPLQITDVATVQYNAGLDSPVGKIEESKVIQFRICPLQGGAKHDGMKKRVKDMLEARGVPSDQINERLTSFISQCPLEKIAVHKDNDDEQLWQKLKELATSVKFRLIKTEELKAFQQKQKQNKAGSTSTLEKKEPGKAKKNKVKGEQAFAAHEVIVDPNHFSADGESVNILELARFGPDQSGLCVATAEQTSQLAVTNTRSPDPLAILAVGKGCEKFGTPFSLPAHTKGGTPIVTQAVLIQCGDIHIDFIMQIPSVTINQEASTVIEFTIERKHVTQWSTTQVPLHYLGVHCPPLRGSNLLAVWAVKAWNGQKASSHHAASHWHGYFRVADTLLTQILGRSGTAGVFYCPKTQAKKHDPRFVAIPIPSASLQETLKQAESCPNALGVVKLTDAFAIRCKREHAASIRTHIMPETAFVAMANINVDDDLYVLRHAPQINREELSEALGEAGWSAQAIKPQGQNRWIVASQQAPPAHHFAINNCIVIVEKLRSESDPQPAAIVATASEVRVDTIRDNNNKIVAVSTSARFAEMRAQIEEQVANAIDARLVNANQQIQQLTHALQEVKRDSIADMTHLKTEQEHTKKKLEEMEQAVAMSGQSIVKQMQQMFLNMEENMTKKMESAVEGAVANLAPVENPEKRAKMEAKDREL
eukprot:Skav205294  [mRNA]  locus=scaffold1587:44243:48436:+ [translate_table: standard]